MHAIKTIATDGVNAIVPLNFLAGNVDCANLEFVSMMAIPCSQIFCML